MFSVIHWNETANHSSINDGHGFNLNLQLSEGENNAETHTDNLVDVYEFGKGLNLIRRGEKNLTLA